MPPPGPDRRQTNAETPRVFGITDGGKGRCFLVAYLNELDLVLVRAQGLEDAVDAVAGKAEDGVRAPVYKAFYERVGYCLRHR